LSIRDLAQDNAERSRTGAEAGHNARHHRALVLTSANVQ
jgi:hypothetical protein